MNNQSNTESHTMKWMKAERELAVRRVVVPIYPNPKHVLTKTDENLIPLIPDKPPKKVQT